MWIWIQLGEHGSWLLRPTIHYCWHCFTEGETEDQRGRWRGRSRAEAPTLIWLTLYDIQLSSSQEKTGCLSLSEAYWRVDAASTLEEGSAVQEAPETPWTMDWKWYRRLASDGRPWGWRAQPFWRWGAVRLSEEGRIWVGVTLRKTFQGEESPSYQLVACSLVSAKPWTSKGWCLHFMGRGTKA